jgi:hypothetical protein
VEIKRKARRKEKSNFLNILEFDAKVLTIQEIRCQFANVIDIGNGISYHLIKL